MSVVQDKVFLEILAPIELKLGLKEGFFSALENEDDWSFLIKLAVIAEAAVARAIEKNLGKPELAEFLLRLNNDGRAGKLRMAETLGILPTNLIRFIQCLARYRNMAAHRLENLDGFDLAAKLGELQPNELRTVARDAVAAPGDDDLSDDFVNAVRDEPKAHFLLGGLVLLMHTDIHEKELRMEQLRQELERRGGWGPLAQVALFDKHAGLVNALRAPPGLGLEHAPAELSAPKD
jgi:hypothetical protein